MTLADFAADYRAATPSAAAEAVAPVLRDIKESLNANVWRLIQGMRHQLQRLRHQVQMAQRTCPDPVEIIQHRAQRIDDLTHRLTRSIGHIYGTCRPRLHSLRMSLKSHSPRRSIRQGAFVIQQLLGRMQKALPSHLSLKRQVLRRLVTLLEDLSPLATLARGYSIVESIPGGDLVRSVGDVQAGTRVRARFSDGHLSCVVEKVQQNVLHLDL